MSLLQEQQLQAFEDSITTEDIYEVCLRAKERNKKGEQVSE